MVKRLPPFWKFELVKQIGVTISPIVLARADRVIR